MRSHASTRGATAALLVAASGPVLYPLWLAGRTRSRRQAAPSTETWPDVTVVIAAYREASVIEEKIHDTYANGYQGRLDIVVVADDDATAAAASVTTATVVAPGKRLGKSIALNRGVAVSTGEVVVFTDANARLVPGALSALARWFADPTVGAVAGAKQVAEQGEGLYWRYESWVKARESLLGSTIGMVGELCAVRRTSWQDLPQGVVVDDLWIALDIASSGGRIVYEPSAAAVELPSVDLSSEWERRTRILLGLLDVLWRRRELLRPGSPVAPQLWGHKLLRATLGPLAHLFLLAAAVTAVRRSRLAAAWLGGHVVAAAGIELARRGRPVPAPVRLAGQVLFLQAVALKGMLRYLSGDRPARWPKPERQGTLPRQA